MNFGQNDSGGDSCSWLFGMLNRDNAFQYRTVVDVRQVWKLHRFGRKHGGVKHHVIILDARHMQGCVVRSGLDSDVSFAPANYPEIFLRNPAADFGIARGMLRHFESTRRSLMRL